MFYDLVEIDNGGYFKGELFYWCLYEAHLIHFLMNLAIYANNLMTYILNISQ